MSLLERITPYSRCNLALKVINCNGVVVVKSHELMATANRATLGNISVENTYARIDLGIKCAKKGSFMIWSITSSMI